MAKTTEIFLPIGLDVTQKRSVPEILVIGIHEDLLAVSPELQARLQDPIVCVVSTVNLSLALLLPSLSTQLEQPKLTCC